MKRPQTDGWNVALVLVGIRLFLMGCSGISASSEASAQASGQALRADARLPGEHPDQHATVNPDGNTIATRFTPPPDFARTELPAASFGAYLRSLPLKPDGTAVHLYNGQRKNRQDVHAAVVDLPIGRRDLHQCADAVMRLYAEHLWARKQYHRIHFNFTNGFRADYTRWRNGERIRVQGNDVEWVPGPGFSDAYADFWSYLEMVFAYAGTLSLASELTPVEPDDLRIGDVFIQGGSPGHAVLVVDLVEQPQTGQRRFLLAQSYMPAQEIHVLKHPSAPNHSPWYSLEATETLITPEWRFSADAIKRFSE